MANDMTNNDLLAALKTEIGWLRNELQRQRTAIEEMQNDLRKLRSDVSKMAKSV